MPTIAGCTIFPADNIFNTPIDSLPVSPSSAAYLTSIGDGVHLHLDLGAETDQTQPEYQGIPYNVVHSNTDPWVTVHYTSTDPDMGWDPTYEADCVDASSGSAHTLVQGCKASSAPNPVLPIPATPLVEGGIESDPQQPYGEHHILMLDADTCRVWETYHSYPSASTGWDIFGSASWDLGSNALRPDEWTSADAAGLPLLPLLLRGDEASAGQIRHALRFSIQDSKIRQAHAWPARHTVLGPTSASYPPMGQLFRMKANVVIPDDFGTQSKAILNALKKYGMYIAGGGSDMFITGEPYSGWDASTITEVQSFVTADFEAVDLSPIMARAGFDPNSAQVPPP